MTPSATVSKLIRTFQISKNRANLNTKSTNLLRTTAFSKIEIHGFVYSNFFNLESKERDDFDESHPKKVWVIFGRKGRVLSKGLKRVVNN